MVMYYDPFYEPAEHEFSADVECNECSEWQNVEGIGFIQSDGDVTHTWECDECHHINNEYVVLRLGD